MAARARGVVFTDLAVIGRQAFLPDRKSLREALHALSPGCDPSTLLRESNGYGEPFYRLLGAKEICSVDASSYENATYIHDMNRPVPDDLKDRFSAVHDGGTLEHVFNFPQAIKNCMEMVRVGGHFIQVGVANNYMGHGFYQYSPELLYRIFSEDNGYAIDAVLLHDFMASNKWYLAYDPKAVGWRIEVWNRRPLYILTIAKRVARVPIFLTYPQQSDYETIWQRDRAADQPRTLTGRIRRRVPAGIKRVGRSLYRHLIGGAFRRDFFKRIPERDVVLGRFGT
jgi:hypothetical protein